MNLEDLRLEWDPEANAGYIELREGVADHTVEVWPGHVYMDVDVKRKALGIEIIDPEGILPQAWTAMRPIIRACLAVGRQHSRSERDTAGGGKDA